MSSIHVYLLPKDAMVNVLGKNQDFRLASIRGLDSIRLISSLIKPKLISAIP